MTAAIDCAADGEMRPAARNHRDIPPEIAPPANDVKLDNVLRAALAALASLSAAERASSVLAPDIIDAAAVLGEAHAAVASLRAEMRARRMEMGPWTRAVKDRSAEIKSAKQAAEAEARRRKQAGTLAEAQAKIAFDLHCGKNGDPVASHHNLSIILGRDPRWHGVIAYNVLTDAVITTKPPPWGEEAPDGGPEIGEWTDTDTTRLAAWLDREWCLTAKTSVIHEAVNVQAHRNRIDPVREYLRSLPSWDGVARLDTWVIRHMRAEDTAYVRAVSRRWMISAVARALRPGCKADCALVLVQPKQGIGKSTAFEALAPHPDWFASNRLDASGKDNEQSIRGKWIVEIGEMSAMSKAEINHLKQFMSTAVDYYRPSYGRRAVNIPRRNIFGGTINDIEFLRDTTGNRRWWPIDVGITERNAVLAGIGAERDQLWAEALAAFDAGEVWYLDDPDLVAMAEAEAEAHRKQDPWEGPISEYLAEQCRWHRGESCNDTRCARCNGIDVSNMLARALMIDPKDQTADKADRARNVLRALRWSPGKQRRCDKSPIAPTGRTRPFYPPAGEPDPDDVERAAIVTQPTAPMVAPPPEEAPAPTTATATTTCPACGRKRGPSGCRACGICHGCTTSALDSPGACTC